MNIIKLDGFKAGFMCFINQTSKCLLKNGNKLYSNLDVLKANIMKNKLKHHEYNILLSFINSDKKRIAISYNDIMKLSEGKYLFYYKDEKYLVIEKEEELIIGAGYVVARNGDKNRIDNYKEGMKIYKDFTTKLFKVCKFLVLHPDLHLKINKHAWKKFQIGFTDNDLKITFLDRDVMVKINQTRVAEGRKALPFIKAMDKYSTLYAYITCDDMEGLNPELIKLGFDFLEYITGNLDEGYPELKVKFERIEIATEMYL